LAGKKVGYLGFTKVSKPAGLSFQSSNEVQKLYGFFAGGGIND